MLLQLNLIHYDLNKLSPLLDTDVYVYGTYKIGLISIFRTSNVFLEDDRTVGYRDVVLHMSYIW